MRGREDSERSMREKLVAFLKKVHLYNFAVGVYLFILRLLGDKCVEKILNKQDARLGKKVSGKVEKIKEIMEGANLSEYKGFVYLFQYSFFDMNGEHYISGGGERYACDLARLLKIMGYKVFLVQIGNEDSESPWQQVMNDITVIGVNAEMTSYFKIIEMLPAPKLAIYSGYAGWGRKLHSPNLMISHGITWDNPSADANTYAIKKILDEPECLVSVDTNTISWLRTAYGASLAEKPKRMIYIPNYADLEVYQPVKKDEEEKIKIIFPRRCSPERGFWLISDVLPLILKKYENVVFEYIGFIHTPDIGNKIKELKEMYPERVIHRLVDADKMYEVYQEADISLIPTLYCEGTSLSCIEAMACGNAVIATNIGGLPNLIINDYNGILINPDKEELSQAIEKVIADPAYRNKIRTNALSVSKEFSKKKWEERWEKLLTEVLGN